MNEEKIGEVIVEEEPVVEPVMPKRELLRYGKLYIKARTYTEDSMENIANLFKVFLPTRIEFLYHANTFELFGYSKQFDEFDDTNARSSYDFPIYDMYIDSDGEVTFDRVPDPEVIQ